MTHIFVFNLSLVIACAYALVKGGQPEQAAAAIFAIAAAATYSAPYNHFHRVELFVLAIDVLTFVALVILSLFANRFWPMYLSALQLMTVSVHGVKAYHPHLVYWIYNGALGKLAYPTLIVLACGVFRHRRRIISFGSDRDWSSASFVA